MPLALLPSWVALLAAVIFTVLGYWALTRLPETEADPGWVVVDEAAGQSLALAAASGWIGVALAFALFRLFDITKPGPVGWADRQKGPFGVMADDVIAGAMAAAAILLLAWMGIR
jgi:phosphatidylglycerophosphatase A